MLEIGARGKELEELMMSLIETNFLNEERFAVAYAGGKFRQKAWGRIKIVRELKLRKISDYCIRAGLREIEEKNYLKALDKLIEKKSKVEKEEHPQRRIMKLAKYCIEHGFEPKLVWTKLKMDGDN